MTESYLPTIKVRRISWNNSTTLLQSPLEVRQCLGMQSSSCYLGLNGRKKEGKKCSDILSVQLHILNCGLALEQPPSFKGCWQSLQQPLSPNYCLIIQFHCYNHQYDLRPTPSQMAGCTAAAVPVSALGWTHPHLKKQLRRNSKTHVAIY